MESGFTLAIPYDQLLLLVMALFMFVGATRGWYRGFISTAVLVAQELALPRYRHNGSGTARLGHRVLFRAQGD